MLDIIKEFMKVADEHDITWWADGGTLLGAVREGGFIEWDTDADVIVPRKDYDKIKAHPEWFEEPYKMVPFGTTHLKIHDIRTTATMRYPVVKGEVQGINIDIFALDDYYDGRVGDFSFGFRPNCIWERSWWENTVELDFEDIKVKCPIGYERVLERQYGDWKTPNPKAGSHDNSKVYFSLEREW